LPHNSNPQSASSNKMQGQTLRNDLCPVPLALEGGPLWKPFCYAQIGGLAVATFITLLLVPVFYSIFVLDLKWIKWETTEDRQETAEAELTTTGPKLREIAAADGGETVPQEFWPRHLESIAMGRESKESSGFSWRIP
jgi:hypothetical protein